MLVTTSYNPSNAAVENANFAAVTLGWRYVERNNDTLLQLRRRHQISESTPMLVLIDDTWRWYIGANNQPIQFHPSMAHVRVKRMLRGEQDVLIRIADIRRGESILDCTAGMASDAIVLAHAVGDEGVVVALESTAVLAFLLQHGLKHYSTDLSSLGEAMRRIQIYHSDYRTYLRQQASASVDVIYFDPMFRTPLQKAHVIQPLRSSVNLAPLDEQALSEAKRVARRLIVLKEAKGSTEFTRLGFEEQRASGHVAYGVIRL